LLNFERGVGRVLLARVCKDAEAPVYLDTSNPANVPYYGSAGVQQIGRARFPCDTPVYYMLRAHPAEPGACGL
jgi:hypothetical protein